MGIIVENSFTLAMETAQLEYCLFQSKGRKWNISVHVNIARKTKVRLDRIQCVSPSQFFLYHPFFCVHKCVYIPRTPHKLTHTHRGDLLHLRPNLIVAGCGCVAV